MKQYKRFILIGSFLLISLSCARFGEDDRAKYEPPDGKVLVFAGQDNASVGGNAHFDDGYVEHIGIPAGITHYIGLKYGDGDSIINGLSIESTWGAGPMCLKYYLESPELKDAIIHLSIDMVDAEEDVAKGNLDYKIYEIADVMEKYSDRPFLIRIGYEFDGSWNHYDSTYFKKAFCRIVDLLKQKNISNFATVFAASSFVVDYQLWENYYPGDDYVDWCGYSYWEGNPKDGSSLKFARDHNKPVFIAEIAPRGYFIDDEDGKKLWDTWYTTLFEHIQDNMDVVRAISYINCDWDSQPMWHGKNWGDTRLEINEYVKEKWLQKMTESTFINSDNDVFTLIGFN